MRRHPANATPRHDFLTRLRIEEIERVLGRHKDIFLDKDLLEIGSGTGVQLERLRSFCRSAIGIEVAGGQDFLPVVTVQEYDGRRLPFPAASFDVVFSSNVMEHIADQAAVQNEIRRVLRPSCVAVHIVPTATWRLWTSIAYYPHLVGRLAAMVRDSVSPRSVNTTEYNASDVTARRRRHLLSRLFPARHGDLGNWLTEYSLFRVSSWRKLFQSHGWNIEIEEPIGLAYSGYSLLAGNLSMAARQSLARILGSSTVLFVLRRP